MAYSWNIGRRFELQADEAVLHQIRSVRFLSTKAWPSYRVTFPIPFLLRVELILTDRRLILLAHLCGLVQSFYTWYPATVPADDREVIRSVEVEKHRWVGDCLLVVTHHPKRMKWINWLVSPTAELRFYISQAKALRQLIAANLPGNV